MLPPEGLYIRNLDDEMLSSLPPPSIRTLSYGIYEGGADFKASAILQREDGIEFNLEMPETSMRLFLPLVGVHNIYNGLAAIVTSSGFVDISLIREALSNFPSPSMRMEVLRLEDITIINDSYNSNPLSFKYAVKTLIDFPSSGKKIVVCADMLELGKSSDRLHFEAGEFVAEQGVDILVVFGEEARCLRDGAVSKGMEMEKVFHFGDKTRIADFLRGSTNDNDVILVKGSRGMRMEEVVECFITCSTR